MSQADRRYRAGKQVTHTEDGTGRLPKTEQP